MSVVTRTNWATNPNAWNGQNFLDIPGTSGATTGSNPNTAGYDGALSFFRVTWTTGTTVVSGGGSYTQTGLSASTQYTHSLYVRTSQANQHLQLQVQYKNSSNTNVGGVNLGANTTMTLANSWVRLSVTATSGALVDRAVLSVIAVTGGANWAISDTLDLDCVLIEGGGALGNFFDGSYTDGLGVDYAWSGTANNSASNATTYSPVLTLTQLTGAPCDRVQVAITDLQAGVTNTVTVWRTADGKRVPVRGYRKMPVVGSDSVVDFECSLGRLITYDLEVVAGPGVGGAIATATITVSATCGWIQDPLDPGSAIALYADDTASGVTLKDTALAKLEMAASVSMIEILGSSDPVALMGQRIAAKGISFAMITNAAQQSTNLRNLINQSPLLLVRPLPSWASGLPGLCYTAAPTPVELPINEKWGGSLIEWTFDTGLVAAPTFNIIVALYKYQDWQALWATYQAAQTTLTGKTYLQVKQRPATG